MGLDVRKGIRSVKTVSLQRNLMAMKKTLKGGDTPLSVPRATNLAYDRKDRLEPGQRGEELKPSYDGRSKRPDGRRDVRFGTWNVGSMTKRYQVCEAIHRRKVTVACVQEV